ncbi:MAG: hypothetical protein R3266_11100, partial [Gemmatimonadota bacterium]|nr:hypothetical protein [Gemmatimonadota bacterium]
MSARRPLRPASTAVVLIALLLALPAATWAGPAPTVEGGVAASVPANNDVLTPGDAAIVGGQVFLEGAGELGAEVTAVFLGSEAG